MTETTTSPGPPPGALRAVPLRRRPDDQVLRGVCAAVARTTGTDPVLWRVAIGVLTLFGGSGLLLYVAGWLLIPEEGQDHAIAERWLHGRDLQVPATLLVVGGLAVVVAGVGDRDGVVPLAVVGLVAYLLLRRTDGAVAPRAAAPAAPAAPPPPATRPGSVRLTKDDAPPAPPTWGAPPPWYAAVPPPPPPPPRAPRPWRPPVTLLTLSAALVVVGALLAAQAAGADGITAARVLAAALAVLGAGLVAGAFWRTGKLLVVPAVLIALALTGAARIDPPLSLSAGDRTWVATAGSEYRLGAGHADLDLSALPPGAASDVEAQVGLGRLVVRVPSDLRVEVVAEVGAGEVRLPGETELHDGEDVREVRTYGPEGAPTVTVRARLGAGLLEVRREP